MDDIQTLIAATDGLIANWAVSMATPGARAALAAILDVHVQWLYLYTGQEGLE